MWEFVRQTKPLVTQLLRFMKGPLGGATDVNTWMMVPFDGC